MPWIVRLRHEKEIVFAEPQQDLMLGRILKQQGGRAGVRVSAGMVDVDWYASLRELVRGERVILALVLAAVRCLP